MSRLALSLILLLLSSVSAGEGAVLSAENQLSQMLSILDQGHGDTASGLDDLDDGLLCEYVSLLSQRCSFSVVIPSTVFVVKHSQSQFIRAPPAII